MKRSEKEQGVDRPRSLARMRFFILCLIGFPALPSLAQDQPRRGTMGDGAYMSQMAAARTIAQAIGEGRASGLRSFFQDEAYFTSLRPRIDSLSRAWEGKGTRVIVGGDISGTLNVMRATVLDDGRELVGELLISYVPSDRVAGAVRLEVVPLGRVHYVKEDIEEPPPTQEELRSPEQR